MENNITILRKYIANILKEGKQVGILYHWTSFASLYNILQENYIKGGQRIRDDVKTMQGDIFYGVSFTRDKFFHGWKNRHYPMEVCIIVDGDKLSNNYKIFPYNDFFDGKFKPNKKEADEMETRTNRSIENVSKYIIRIELYHNDGGASEKEQLDFIKYYGPYKNVYKGFDINNYVSIDQFKIDLCNYVKSHNIDCIIK